MLGDLDKTNQVAALATAVAVEQILAGVDVERRTSVAVQGTKPDELLLPCRRASCPVAQKMLEYFTARVAGFEDVFSSLFQVRRL